MILAGLKLTVLGMGIVICFLLLLVFFINVARSVLAAGSARELAEMEASDLRKRKKNSDGTEHERLVAIISAAIAAHRSRAGSAGNLLRNG